MITLAGPSISPLHPWCLHTDAYLLNPGTGAWPVANLAIYIPFCVPAPTIIRGLGVPIESSSGNLDLGIYKYDGTRIVSSGSVATSGYSANLQNITDTDLAPGVYYLALALDNNVANVYRDHLAARELRYIGMCQEASAFPLPATATFAAMDNSYMPFTFAQLGRIL